MLIFVSLLLACSTDSQEPSEVKKVAAMPVEQPSLIQPKAHQDVKSTKQVSSPDPLADKSLVEICQSNGLSLIQWSFEDRSQRQTELCCGPNGLAEEFCEWDWPSSDVPSCDLYDEMRNEIFARYGRSFKTARWKEHFDTQAWYTANPNYQNSWLNETAKRNVERLLEMKANKIGCMY